MEKLDLSQSEKKMTSAELAIDHINLESEKAEQELKNEKFYGRLLELVGGAGLVSAVFALSSLLGGDLHKQELNDALSALDFERIASISEGRQLIVFTVGYLVGSLNLAMGIKKINDAIKRAAEKKNYILKQYLGRTENQPQP